VLLCESYTYIGLDTLNGRNAVFSLKADGSPVPVIATTVCSKLCRFLSRI
jgi:hypothetical protein